MCFGGERRLGLRLRPDSYPVVVDVFLGERRLVVRVEARAGSHWRRWRKNCVGIYFSFVTFNETLRAPQPTPQWRGEVVSHVAMVAKFLDDNKPIKSLKSLFALFQTSPILFNFILFGKSWRNFLWDRIYRYLSLEKEGVNFCVVFTYSIKRAREIKKFHVMVVQDGKEMYKIARCTCKVVVCWYKHIIFAVLLAVAVVVGVVVIQKNSPTMETWRHTSPLYLISLQKHINSVRVRVWTRTKQNSGLLPRENRRGS